MTTYIEIDIPVYGADTYDELAQTGRIKVSSNISSLEEGVLTQEYERLKKEIDILVANTNSRTRLASEVSTLEDEIRRKSRERDIILRDIERATKHYNTLQAFLRTVGVDPSLSRFTVEPIFLPSPPSDVELSATEKYRPSEEF